MAKNKHITAKILKLKDEKNLTFDDLAIWLDMTRVTLNTRINKHNWKKTEIFFIKNNTLV